MDEKQLSTSYDVRRLDKSDAGAVCRLCRGNPLFYRFHPPMATRESVLEDMEALPPGKTAEDKYFVGFFAGGSLVACMDLVLGYPAESTAYIGFFMMDAAFQGRGVGSAILEEALACLKSQGFAHAQLGVDKGNPQSMAFWLKNRFAVIGEGAYIRMERPL